MGKQKMSLSTFLEDSEPASAQEIAELRKAIPKVPKDYVAFLERSNGGWCVLPGSTAYLRMFDINQVLENRDLPEGVWVIGLDGGSGTYLLDMTTGKPRFGFGDEGVVESMGSTFEAFLKKLVKENPGPKPLPASVLKRIPPAPPNPPPEGSGEIFRVLLPGPKTEGGYAELGFNSASDILLLDYKHKLRAWDLRSGQELYMIRETPGTSRLCFFVMDHGTFVIAVRVEAANPGRGEVNKGWDLEWREARTGNLVRQQEGAVLSGMYPIFAANSVCCIVENAYIQPSVIDCYSRQADGMLHKTASWEPAPDCFQDDLLAISPDGAQCVVRRRVRGPCNEWNFDLRRSDGTARRPVLATQGVLGGEASFSPDGHWVLLENNHDHALPRSLVFDATAGAKVADSGDTFHPREYPAKDPFCSVETSVTWLDDARFLFGRDGKEGGLWICTFGGGAQALTQDPTNAFTRVAVSPDRKLVACCNYGDECLNATQFVRVFRI